MKSVLIYSIILSFPHWQLLLWKLNLCRSISELQQNKSWCEYILQGFLYSLKQRSLPTKIVDTVILAHTLHDYVFYPVENVSTLVHFASKESNLPRPAKQFPIYFSKSFAMKLFSDSYSKYGIKVVIIYFGENKSNFRFLDCNIWRIVFCGDDTLTFKSILAGV